MIKKCFYCFILLPLLISIMWAENLPPEKTKVLIDPSLEPAVLNTNQEILYPISEGRQIDTLIYDDGSPSSGYYWGAGARMANRMSPTQACQILTIQYYCWSRGGSETIDATIYDWTGTMPGSQLGTSVSLPMDATQQWRNADFSSQNINVTGDFIASFNMNNDQTVIGFDAVNNGRAWDYNGTSWSAWNETYFIRAIVDYGGTGEPDIECNPNPLNVSAKDWGNFLQFTYRNYPMKIDERLMEKMENVSPEELLPVIIECDKLIDTDFLYSLVKGMGKAERRSFTINTLQEFTSSYQEDVYEYLESMENAGKVDRLSQLWLTNSIGMKATKAVINEVSKYPTVALIWLDDIPLKPHVVTGSEFSNIESIPESRAVVWNVQKVNADQVWPLGYTGQNIIVGHIDTGVNYNHVDLADHLWDGGASYPNHGWDFDNNDNNPMDDNGHGTHTAGTVAGDGTAGTETGVAPDAQIMILKALGGLTIFQSAVNFALSHGADVMTMSAGYDSANAGASWNYLSTQDRNVLNNCLTAGVVFVTSAGNGDNMGGHYSIPYDISIPANIPAPWYGSAGHSSCMAVGSTNQNNSVSSFSSRGATQWWFTPWYEYSYPPGLIKPDVAAPGGSPGITSLSYTNNTGYAGGYAWQGTSMSCPHVTGTIALMLSKDPSLTPEELDSIIEETCLDLGTAGKDNYYGAGLINALDAVNAVGGGSATSGTFYCKNVGDANLDVTNIVKSASWITSVSPTAFTVVPSDSQGVTVNIDESGLPGGTYHDTLWISSNDPDEDPYAEVVILSIGTGIEEEPAVKIVPAAYTIKCYPNPARNAASVRFSLPRKGHISLDVYDVTGRNVSTIVNGEFNSGTHSIVWNRKDNKGVKVPQGIYFIRLKAEGMEAQGKLILLN